MEKEREKNVYRVLAPTAANKKLVRHQDASQGKPSSTFERTITDHTNRGSAQLCLRITPMQTRDR